MKETTAIADNNYSSHSFVISEETVIATVVKHLHTPKETDISLLSPALQQQHALWHNYPSNADIEETGTLLRTRREKDISDTLNAVQEHLTTLLGGSDDTVKLLRPFAEDGLLRKNLMEHATEDDVILFMKEHLSYISLLTGLANKKNERDASVNALIEEKLNQFPTSNNAEYGCLEGSRDRQDIPRIALELEKIPLEERVVLAAHREITEQARRKFSPAISNENQPHLMPAIEYLYGIENKTKRHAKSTSMQIAAERAWKLASGYVKALNTELVSQRAENICGIEYLMDSYPSEKPGSFPTVGKILELRGITLESICTVPEEEEDTFPIPAWDKSKIPALFPIITVENPVTLPVPESLFAPDVPDQIADLINSDVPANQAMGVKALLLMGHEGQIGASPIQFLNTIHALRSRGIDLGSKKNPENTALNSNIDTILRRINIYSHNDNMLSYTNYLQGGALPPIAVFFSGNAPAHIIQKQIANASSEALNGSLAISRIFHNPGRQLILDSLLYKQNECVSDKTASNIGEKLTALGAKYRDLEIIHYVRRGFLTADKASGIENSKSYTNGPAMVRTGLLSLFDVNLTGLEYLASYDADMLKGIIGTVPQDGGDSVSPDILRTYSNNSTIIHTLAIKGDKLNLAKLLRLVPAEEQHILLTQQENDIFGYTALHLAAKEGRINVIAFLTTDSDGPKIDVNILDKKGRTPLMVAADYGHLKAVEALLEAGADTTLQENTEVGFTALHWAANQGHTDLIKLLAAKGDVNIRDKKGRTSLMEAAACGHLKAVEALLEAGAKADLQANTETGFTALHMAAQNGHADLIKPLATKGDVNIRDKGGLTPLMKAAARGHLKAVEALLEAGAKADLQDNAKPGFTALHWAAQNGHADLIKPLATKVDVDIRDKEGHTPLMVAAIHGKLKAVEALLEAGAKADLQDNTEAGFTTLHWAVQEGHIDVIAFLTTDSNGPKIDVNILDKKGRTPLMVAAALGKLKAVEALLEAGADTTLQANTEAGFTALHWAAKNGHADLIKPLAAKVDVDIRDKRGLTPLMVAADRGKLKAVEALLEAGAQADLQVNTEEGFTALHWAAQEGHINVIVFLTTDSNGPKIDVNILDKKGRTPLMVAAARGNLKAVEALLEAGAKADLQDNTKMEFTALHWAAQSGHVDLIKPLAAKGGIDIRDKESRTALMAAVVGGNLKAVEALLEVGADATLQDNTEAGFTALHWAVSQGYADLIEPLAAKGGVDIRDKRGLTPLMVAAAHGKLKAVEALLEAGAKADLQGNTEAGFTALHWAARKGHADLIEPLAAKGGIDIRDKKGRTALMEAAAGGKLKAVEALLEAGADATLQENTEAGFTALHLAAKKGHADLIKPLAKKGGVDIRDKKGFTPLMVAAIEGKLEAVEALLDAGAKADLQDAKKGLTALHWAADKGHVHIIKYLATKVDVDIWDKEGLTPLMVAASLDELETVDVLLETVDALLKAGANARLQEKTENGRTALHYALHSPNQEMFNIIWNACSGEMESTDKATLLLQIKDRQGNSLLHGASADRITFMLEGMEPANKIIVLSQKK